METHHINRVNILQTTTPTITTTNPPSNLTSTNVMSFAQIQNLALKECAKEVDVACYALGISAGKYINIDFNIFLSLIFSMLQSFFYFNLLIHLLHYIILY